MNRRTVAAVTTGALLALTGCSVIPAPDQIGLYYMEGPSDGYQFGECISPGQTGPGEWNNSVVFLPTSLRTWLIDDVDIADDKDPLVLAAAAQEGQPSGVEVRLNIQATFMLNTFCDKNGGVIRQFWETIGRRYAADTDEGWSKMLKSTISVTLKSVAKEVVRKYDADALVSNKDGVQQLALTEIASKFATELNRLAGGPFFCGPGFNAASSDCPSVEIQMVGVELANQGLRDARNEKQRQLELAAARLAEARGIADALVAKANGEAEAARALNALYNTPGWVEIQKTIKQAEALVEACKVAKECRLIVGADGNLIMA